MKRGHRRAHLLLWLIVGPAALCVLWRALADRPPRPVQPATRTTETAGDTATETAGHTATETAGTTSGAAPTAARGGTAAGDDR